MRDTSTGLKNAELLLACSLLALGLSGPSELTRVAPGHEPQRHGPHCIGLAPSPHSRDALSPALMRLHPGSEGNYITWISETVGGDQGEKSERISK